MWGWRLASCSPVLGTKASGLRVVMFEWQVDLIHLVLSCLKTVREHDLAITMWFSVVASWWQAIQENAGTVFCTLKAQNFGLGRLVEEDSKLALNWTAVTKKRKMPLLAIQCFHSCQDSFASCIYILEKQRYLSKYFFIMEINHRYYLDKAHSNFENHDWLYSLENLEIG